MTEKPAVVLSEEQIRTAMKSPAHLQEWLEKSGRAWMVFNSKDLIKALPWPTGVEALMQVIACYRDHRATIPTGETQMVEGKEQPVYYPETLTVPEMDRAVRWLIGQLTSVDPTWSLDKPSL